MRNEPGARRSLRLSLFAVLWGATLVSYGQAHLSTVERLRQQLRGAPHDTARAALLIAITDDASVNDPDTITALCEKVLVLADQHLRARPSPGPLEWRAWRHLQASAYNNLGVAAYHRGQAAQSISRYEQALRIRRQLGDHRGELESYHNLGLMYAETSNLLRALHYFDTGLHQAETLRDSAWIGNYTRTLGDIYGDMGEADLQLQYLRRSFRMLSRSRDLSSFAEVSVVLGNAYLLQGQPDSAARLLRRGLALARRTGDDVQVAVAQRLLGQLALRAGSPDSAEAYIQTALRLQQQQNYAIGIGATLSALGRVAAARQQWARAIQLTEQGLAHARRAGTTSQQVDIELQLSDYYAATSAAAPALVHFRRYVALRDTIRAEQSQRTVLRQQMESEAARRETTQRAARDKEQVVAAAEIRRQRLLRNALAAGALALLTVAALLAQRFRASQRARRVIGHAKEVAERERDRADELLLNILPAETAAELKTTGKALARQHEQVTVLFSDVVGFTQLAETLSPQELVSTLDAYFGAFDALCGEYNLEKIKTIGDAYLLTGGLNGQPAAAPLAVVRCALAMQAAATRLAVERAALGLPIFQLRIGIHTGPVVAGIVGVRKFAYDIWGDTVNTAARMEQGGEAGRVNVSQVTYALIADEFVCVPRGRIEAKHKGAIAMYFVEAANQPIPIAVAT